MAKFSISKNDLYQNLKMAGRMVPAKSTLPTFTNFLFKIEKSVLTITGASEVGMIRLTTQCTSDDDFTLCVNAAQIISGLSEIPEQPISIEFDGKSQITVYYKDGCFKLPATNGKEYVAPRQCKAEKEIKTTCTDFLRGLHNTIFAAGTDELRPVMSGVYIDFAADKTKFVATDATFMAIIEQSGRQVTDNHSFILPREIGLILDKIIPDSDDELIIKSDKDNAEFMCGNTTMSVRLIEGKYPNYAAVLPTTTDKTAIVETEMLRNAVKRIGIFSGNINTLQIKFAKEKIDINTIDTDFGTSAEEQIPVVVYTGDGIEIGVKANKFLEILSHIPERMLAVKTTAPDKVILLEPDGSYSKFLIMPTVIQKKS